MPETQARTSWLPGVLGYTPQRGVWPSFPRNELITSSPVNPIAYLTDRPPDESRELPEPWRDAPTFGKQFGTQLASQVPADQLRQFATDFYTKRPEVYGAGLGGLVHTQENSPFLSALGRSAEQDVGLKVFQRSNLPPIGRADAQAQRRLGTTDVTPQKWGDDRALVGPEIRLPEDRGVYRGGNALGMKTYPISILLHELAGHGLGSMAARYLPSGWDTRGAATHPVGEVVPRILDQLATKRINDEMTRRLQRPMDIAQAMGNVAAGPAGGIWAQALSGVPLSEAKVQYQSPSPFNPGGRDRANPFGEIYRSAWNELNKTNFWDPRTQQEALNIWPAILSKPTMDSIVGAARRY